MMRAESRRYWGESARRREGERVTDRVTAPFGRGSRRPTALRAPARRQIAQWRSIAACCLTLTAWARTAMLLGRSAKTWAQSPLFCALLGSLGAAPRSARASRGRRTEASRHRERTRVRIGALVFVPASTQLTRSRSPRNPHRVPLRMPRASDTGGPRRLLEACALAPIPR
jgi:hypothetical protein